MYVSPLSCLEAVCCVATLPSTVSRCYMDFSYVKNSSYHPQLIFGAIYANPPTLQRCGTTVVLCLPLPGKLKVNGVHLKAKVMERQVYSTSLYH